MSQPIFTDTRTRLSKASFRPPAGLILGLLLTTAPTAWATPPPDLSEHGSVGLSAATLVSVIDVSVDVLMHVPELSVTGVEVSAEGAVWLVTGVVKGSGEAVSFSIRAAGGMSMAVGTTLEVVTGVAGSMLRAGGESVAFIPNAVGSALFYSTTWEDRDTWEDEP